MTRLKFSFIINDEYTWSFFAIKPMISCLAKKHSIESLIIVPDKLGKFDFFSYIVWYLKTFGAYNFLILTLFTIKRNFQRKSKSDSTWSSLSRKYNFQIIKSDSVNSNFIINWFNDNKIDIVFLHTSQIVNRKIIDSVNIGIINKHASILPSCRGVFPFFWSRILNLPCGITLHTISDEIDRGKNLVQVEYQTKKSLTLLGFYKKIYSYVPKLALISIIRLIRNEFIENRKGIIDSYYSFPEKSDYIKFIKGKNSITTFSDLL